MAEFLTTKGILAQLENIIKTAEKRLAKLPLIYNPSFPSQIHQGKEGWVAVTLSNLSLISNCGYNIGENKARGLVIDGAIWTGEYS